MSAVASSSVGSSQSGPGVSATTPLIADAQLKLNELETRVQRHIDAIIAEVESSSSSSSNSSNELVTNLIDLVPNASARRVGFLGQRGVGKTTLFNRLLDVPRLLPVVANSAATACITEAHAWPFHEDGTVQNTNFVAHITLLNAREWESQLEDACEEMDAWRKSESRGDIRSELKDWPFVNAMIVSLEALAKDPGSSSDVKHTVQTGDRFEFEDAKYRADPLLLLPSNLRDLVQQSFVTFNEESGDKMAERLLPYASRQSSRWPLVFKISLHGPFSLLQKHSFSLLDIPGDGDGDPVLGHRFVRGQNLCDYLFYLPVSTQVDSDKTVDEVLELCNTLDDVPVTMLVTKCGDASEEPGDAAWLTPDVARKNLRSRLVAKGGDNPLGVKRKQLENLPLYFVENKPALQNDYKAHWDDFLTSMLLPMDRDSNGALCRYVNQLNDTFNLLRTSLQSTQQRREAVGSALCVRQSVLFPGGNHEAIAAHCNLTSLQPLVSGAVTDVNFVGCNPFVERDTHPSTLKAMTSGKNSKKLPINLVQAASVSSAAVASVVNTLTTQQEFLRNGVVADLLQHAGNIDQQLLEGALASVRRPDLFPLRSSHVQFAGLTQAMRDALHGYGPFRAAWIQCQQTSVSGPKPRDRTVQLLQQWADVNVAHVLFVMRGAIKSYVESELRLVARLLYNALAVSISSLRATSNGMQTQRLLQLIPHEIKLEEVAIHIAAPKPQANAPVSLSAASGTPSAPVVPISAAVAVAANAPLTASARLAAYMQQHSLAPVSIHSLQMRNTRSANGSVYLLSNPSFRLDTCFKVGLTKRPVAVRMRELFRTGVPTPFHEECAWQSRQIHVMERYMHLLFAPYRVHDRREFFDFPLQGLKEVGDVVRQLVEDM